MCKVVAYMRISTKEERGKQKFTRQEQAIARWSKENNIEIFIDDSCRNCKDIAYNSNAKVFIMDTRVNQNLEDEKITRVYSWPHLYKEIKKLKEEN